MPSAGSASQGRLHETMQDLIIGYMRSQAIRTAAMLGIADLLVDGPKTAADLATATGAHTASLHRLLRALAGEGVFREETDGAFALTPLAELLRSDRPDSMRARAIWMPAQPYAAWLDMPASIQTGEVAFDRVHGEPFFRWLAGHPDESEQFNRAMSATSARAGQAVLDAYDFGAFGTIVDIGGGNGRLLAAILAAYPATRGVLFDQPHVVAAPATAVSLRDVADRCEVVGGSFFASVPSGGDAYLLRKIVHDWDDARSIEILRACRHAMGDSARLLLVESVLKPANEPDFAKWLDLHMLAMLGGQERTEAEYAELLAAAGFTLTRVVPTASVDSVIEAIPA